MQDLQKALRLDPDFREPARVLEVMGVHTRGANVEVAESGLDGWRVFSRGRQYIATSEQYPRVKVDIEMLGKGEPRILEWELKTAPFAGVGVLRFHVGTVEGLRGAEEVEQIAIVDVHAGTVVGYETHRVAIEVEVRFGGFGIVVVLEEPHRGLGTLGLEEDRHVDEVAVGVAGRDEPRRMGLGLLPMGLRRHPELGPQAFRRNLERTELGRPGPHPRDRS